jgi:hypothetical protein
MPLRSLLVFFALFFTCQVIAQDISRSLTAAEDRTSALEHGWRTYTFSAGMAVAFWGVMYWLQSRSGVAGADPKSAEPGAAPDRRGM